MIAEITGSTAQVEMGDHYYNKELSGHEKWQKRDKEQI
jgi:hypothetical protein